jgi:hypothetical protein
MVKSVCVTSLRQNVKSAVQLISAFSFVITDANTLIQVTQTHLPEAIFQDGDESSSRAHVAPVSTSSVVEREHNIHDSSDDPSIPTLEDDDSKPHYSHGLPLSPTTSESSGPHSPTGSFGYPMNMVPSVHVIPPHESPMVTKSMNPSSGYLPGYYAQPFVPEKGPGFWSNANSMGQYGY